jgi:sulfite reductase (NADPH) flavoprotein alpha-component
MLGDTKLRTLQELIDNSTQEELIWISGYLAGLLRHGAPAEPATKPAVQKLTLAFGTDTGNSKKLASTFASKAKKSGVHVKLQSLDQYRLSDLPKEEYFLVVISTHGEGEPPAAAKKFYDYIHENTSRLDKLNYAVLALGDTSYPLYCKAGEDVDVRLETLGAARLLPLQKCDTDFETDASAWFEDVLKTLGSAPATVPSAPVVRKKSNHKKNYQGTILSNVNLSGRGSEKQTHHIEIEAGEVDYQPGDSIGIVPENPSEIVEAVIQLVNASRNKKLQYREEEITVYDLLKKKLNIVYLPERVVKQYAAIVLQEIPSTRIDLLNLLKIYPVKDAAQFEEVIGILEPITPRLYSIASSLAAHSGEVHITVARDHFTVNDEVGYGLCTNYLVNLTENSSFEFYIHRNSEFKLPQSNKDIIMIGPGTGIAPFRSFIEERDASGASGRNWLFFGDQHFQSDFLYQTEIQSYLQTGALTRVDVAFSRDQAEKVYVQHKVMSKGYEFYQWLEAGASVYLCGTREPMSVDVEDALVQVIREFGNKTTEQAQDYLLQLKEEGRYQKDVY